MQIHITLFIFQCHGELETDLINVTHLCFMPCSFWNFTFHAGQASGTFKPPDHRPYLSLGIWQLLMSYWWWNQRRVSVLTLGIYLSLFLSLCLCLYADLSVCTSVFILSVKTVGHFEVCRCLTVYRILKISWNRRGQKDCRWYIWYCSFHRRQSTPVFDGFLRLHFSLFVSSFFLFLRHWSSILVHNFCLACKILSLPAKTVPYAGAIMEQLSFPALESAAACCQHHLCGRGAKCPP